MHIDSEQKAREVIESWRKDPPRAQLRFLKEAFEALEMSQMYYDQKGNEKGCCRCAKCLEILQARITVVEKELPLEPPATNSHF